MSLLKEFQLAFESGTLASDDDGVITPTEVQAIHEGQSETQHVLSKDDLNADQITKVASLVGNLDKNLTTIKATSPALITPMVPIVNGQIADTANYLGIQPPPPLTLDASTNTLDEVSVEGVNAWVSRVWDGFRSALDKLTLRVKTTLTRFKVTATSLVTRIDRVGQVVRRSNGLTDKPLKLDSKYLANLIMGKGLANDLIGELNRLGAAITSITEPSHQLTKVISDLLIDILEGEDEDRNVKAEVFKLKEYTVLTKAMETLVKEKQGFIGNRGYLRTSLAQAIPRGTFTDQTPSGASVAAKIPSVPNLDLTQVKSMLGELKKEVLGQMTSIDVVTDAMYDEVNELSNMKVKDSPGVIMDDSGLITNFSKDYIADYYDLVDSLGETFYYYFYVADSILAYIEESVLND